MIAAGGPESGVCGEGGSKQSRESRRRFLRSQWRTEQGSRRLLGLDPASWPTAPKFSCVKQTVVPDCLRFMDVVLMVLELITFAEWN